MARIAGRLVLGAFLLLMIAPLAAVGQTAALEVRSVDPSGVPIVSVSVQIPQPDLLLVTDTEGFAVFERIPIAEVSSAVEPEQPRRARLRVATVSYGGSMVQEPTWPVST